MNKLFLYLKNIFFNLIEKIYWYNRFKGNHKEYSLLLGRWQCLPPHEGHIGLVNVLLKENKNVLIALRKSDSTDKNPYGFIERKKAFNKMFKKEISSGKVKIVEIEDIVEVAYGRTPGWKIREIDLSEDLKKISATKIRKEKSMGE